MLREDVLAGSGLIAKEFAARLSVNREAFYNVLGGRKAVSSTLVLKLSKLLGTSPEMWLVLRQAYNPTMMARERADEIERIKTLNWCEAVTS